MYPYHFSANKPHLTENGDHQRKSQLDKVLKAMDPGLAQAQRIHLYLSYFISGLRHITEEGVETKSKTKNTRSVS